LKEEIEGGSHILGYHVVGKGGEVSRELFQGPCWL